MCSGSQGGFRRASREAAYGGSMWLASAVRCDPPFGLTYPRRCHRGLWLMSHVCPLYDNDTGCPRHYTATPPSKPPLLTTGCCPAHPCASVPCPQLRCAVTGLCLCVSMDLPQERVHLLPCALAGLMLSTVLVGAGAVRWHTVINKSSSRCWVK